MIVYLLHFEQEIGNAALAHAKARHYLGSTQDLEKRIEEHKSGTSNCSIVRAFRKRGIRFCVAITWNVGRDFEKYLKKSQKNSLKLCPICMGLVKLEEIEWI
jgi:predicted GIY-YIG superfamily endonuclease